MTKWICCGAIQGDLGSIRCLTCRKPYWKADRPPEMSKKRKKLIEKEKVGMLNIKIILIQKEMNLELARAKH